MSTEVLEFDPTKPLNLTAWKKKAVHTVTLPSSSVVQIKIPDLPAMIEAGTIPQHLLDVALGAAAAMGDDKVLTKDDIILQREFTDKIVQLTVINPKLADDDLGDLPFEDKEMLVEFAMRTRDIDALNRHIGGIDRARKFLEVSEGSDSDENVEGA